MLLEQVAADRQAVAVCDQARTTRSRCRRRKASAQADRGRPLRGVRKPDASPLTAAAPRPGGSSRCSKRRQIVVPITSGSDRPPRARRGRRGPCPGTSGRPRSACWKNAASETRNASMPHWVGAQGEIRGRRRARVRSDNAHGRPSSRTGPSGSSGWLRIPEGPTARRPSRIRLEVVLGGGEVVDHSEGPGAPGGRRPPACRCGASQKKLTTKYSRSSAPGAIRGLERGQLVPDRPAPVGVVGEDPPGHPEDPRDVHRPRT